MRDFYTVVWLYSIVRSLIIHTGLSKIFPPTEAFVPHMIRDHDDEAHRGTSSQTPSIEDSEKKLGEDSAVDMIGNRPTFISRGGVSADEREAFVRRAMSVAQLRLCDCPGVFAATQIRDKVIRISCSPRRSANYCRPFIRVPAFFHLLLHIGPVTRSRSRFHSGSPRSRSRSRRPPRPTRAAPRRTPRPRTCHRWRPS